MKATGIIRRVDDLGRIVIPKDIRKTNGIREGDPMEIYVGERGEIIFRQYSAVTNIFNQINDLRDNIEAYCDVGNADVDRALQLLNTVQKIICK